MARPPRKRRPPPPPAVPPRDAPEAEDDFVPQSRRRPSPVLLAFFGGLVLVVLVAAFLLPGDRSVRGARAESRRLQVAREMESEELWLAAADEYERLASDSAISREGRSEAAERAGEIAATRLEDPAKAVRLLEKAYFFADARGRRETLKTRLEGLRDADGASPGARLPGAPAAGRTLPSPLPEGTTAIARVGDSEVALEDILYAWRRTQPDRAPTEDLLHDFTLDYLNVALLAEGALREGLVEKPAFRMESRFQERQLLSSAILSTADPTEEPSAEELRAAYEERREELVRPPGVRLEHLLVREPAEVEAVRTRLAAGEDFAAVAAELGVDRDKLERGCEIGWVDAESAFVDWVGSVPGLADSLVKLDDGATTGPVVSPRGTHWFRIAEKRPAEAPPFEAVEEKLRREVAASKRKRAREALLERLRESIPTEIREAELKSALEKMNEATARMAEPSPAPSPAADPAAGPAPPAAPVAATPPAPPEGPA